MPLVRISYTQPLAEEGNNDSQTTDCYHNFKHSHSVRPCLWKRVRSETHNYLNTNYYIFNQFHARIDSCGLNNAVIHTDGNTNPNTATEVNANTDIVRETNAHYLCVP